METAAPYPSPQKEVLSRYLDPGKTALTLILKSYI